jgi:hypothetical protein
VVVKRWRIGIFATAETTWGIYKAYVNANLSIGNGDNLHLIFLAYDNTTVETENVI